MPRLVAIAEDDRHLQQNQTQDVGAHVALCGSRPSDAVEDAVSGPIAVDGEESAKDSPLGSDGLCHIARAESLPLDNAVILKTLRELHGVHDDQFPKSWNAASHYSWMAFNAWQPCALVLLLGAAQ